MKSFSKGIVFLLAVAIAFVSLLSLLVTRYQSGIFRSLVGNIPWAGNLHVVAGALALILGGLQISSRLRGRNLELHRRIGTAYVGCVLLGSVGALVAVSVSSTPWIAKSAFVLLGITWPMITLAGYPRGVAFDVRHHGRLMIYSYALTCAAISLRLILAAVMIAGYGFSIAYPIAAWGGFLGNVVIAKLIFTIQDRKANTIASL